jgi:hypothetical protein
MNPSGPNFLIRQRLHLGQPPLVALGTTEASTEKDLI